MSLTELIAAVEELTWEELRTVRAALDAEEQRRDSDALDRLAQRGIIRRGTGKLGHVTPAVIETDVPVSEILIAERR